MLAFESFAQPSPAQSRSRDKAGRVSVSAAELLAVILVVSCISLLTSARVAADAVIAPSPIFSNAQGLPDGRVYEEVSPANKDGSSAGATTDGTIARGETGLVLARADGQAIYYYGGSQLSNAVSGLEVLQVADRTATGWRHRPALPKPIETLGGGEYPRMFVPSLDLSHLLFVGAASFVTGDPAGGPNIYLAGEDPSQQPAWVGRPTISTPSPPLGSIEPSSFQPAGGSTDLNTVYFAYPGTLTEEDSPRAPHLSLGGYGFYEWTQGDGLASAGVLPAPPGVSGTVSPFGATPAGEPDQGNNMRPATFDNEVSEDGRYALFVSPDPKDAAGCNTSDSGPGGCIPQLYVRERASDGERSTVLVSRDTLLSGNDGLPALAPHGVLPVVAPAREAEFPHEGVNSQQTYAYASPDGRHVFFESADRLTGEAPNDGLPKEYDFDTFSNTLEYLPGVTGGTGNTAAVTVSSPDGSRFLFVRMSPTNGAVDLDLWSEGPGGGSVSEIAQLPSVPFGAEYTHVNSGRASADGSAFVFATNSPLPGGFNNMAVGSALGLGIEEIYRYNAAENSLSCVSCPPMGTAPTGSAILSHREFDFELTRDRGMSSDGDRVFFDTPDPLVPRDTNGVRDVYEWENGVVHLISAGTGPADSLILDSSENGDDVFFATTDGLAPGDTDGAYDVYDARVPHLGEGPPPAAEQCTGEACQGLVNEPQSMTAPASATLLGPANLAAAPTKTLKLIHKQVKSKKKKTKAKKDKKHRGKATRSRAIKVTGRG
jgi:hypothetical protein